MISINYLIGTFNRTFVTALAASEPLFNLSSACSLLIQVSIPFPIGFLKLIDKFDSSYLLKLIFQYNI